MGLYVNSPQGLQMISGRGKAVYGASDIRKKTITTSVPGNSYVSINVTFDDPLDSADYLVEVTGSSVADLSYLIFDKTVNGFKVYWSNYWPTSENVTATYTAYKLYTDLEYNGLLNNQRYSTDEIDTGKVWIDGKKIYRKVITIDTQTRIEGSRDLGEIPNADSLVYAVGIGDDRSNSSSGIRMILSNAVFYIDASNHFVISSFTGTFYKFRFIAEYTKTI